MKFFLIFFCIFISTAYGADFQLVKKLNDKMLEKVSKEFSKLSSDKSYKKFKILNRKGESSLLVIGQITRLNFNPNKAQASTIQVEELKFSNDILVSLSTLFTSIHDAGEGRVEISALSKFESFLVDHLATSSYRLFSSWNEAEINSCYGFYIESKTTEEVLALGNCF